ncbi:MAG: oligoendopeptidase F [Chloroflexota bacterium]
MAQHVAYNSRADIPERYKWDLTAMYRDDTAWEADAARVPAVLATLTAFRGTMTQSAHQLAGVLHAHEQAGRLIDKLWQYAARHRDEDMSSSRYNALFERASALRDKLAAASSFLSPALLELHVVKFALFMQEEPALRTYVHFVNNLQREQPHLLTSSEEALLAQAVGIASSPQVIHSMLTDADVLFGTVKDERGVEVPLTRAVYERLVRSSDQEIRREAYETFFAGYMDHKNSVAAIYAANVKQSVFFARARKHESSLKAALFADNIPVVVYTNLIRSVRNHLPLLHRYIALRKRALGLDEIHMYDLANSLLDDTGESIAFDDAAATVLEALSPLGTDYVGAARAGLAARWIDVYETPNKRGGAHSAGCYDTYPYLMLNYLDTLLGTYTLAHEMGHSMHSYYSFRTQPYHYAYYSDFLAEVASILNEALMTHYQLQHAQDKQVRIRVINLQLEIIRYSLFRQTMLAEFERFAHKTVERGEALTADLLCDTFYRLCKEYHGDGIVVDEVARIEWAYLPHLYYNFYVYQYATGVAAASALAAQIVDEGEPAAARVRRFLASGSSAYTMDLLRDAGVDMTSPEPVERTAKLFEQRLNELERLLERE